MAKDFWIDYDSKTKYRQWIQNMDDKNASL